MSMFEKFLWKLHQVVMTEQTSILMIENHRSQNADQSIEFPQMEPDWKCMTTTLFHVIFFNHNKSLATNTHSAKMGRILQ